MFHQGANAKKSHEEQKLLYVETLSLLSLRSHERSL
jgi:hypothetical protein